jgi:hypothetical protein
MMSDTLPTSSPKDLLDEARNLFSEHGHDLSDAARLIAGVHGDVRVISLALRLERAICVDDGIHRDLAMLHALLALEDVQEGDPIETFLLSGLGPASRKVETICLLTDLLEDLLSKVDAVMADTAQQENNLQTFGHAKAA